MKIAKTAQSFISSVDESINYINNSQKLIHKFIEERPDVFLPHAFKKRIENNNILPLIWARGMYLSRGFTEQILSKNDKNILNNNTSNIKNNHNNSNIVRGCLLPIIDLLNHKQDQPITWSCTSKNVLLVCDSNHNLENSKDGTVIYIIS